MRYVRYLLQLLCETSVAVQADTHTDVLEFVCFSGAGADLAARKGALGSIGTPAPWLPEDEEPKLKFVTLTRAHDPTALVPSRKGPADLDSVHKILQNCVATCMAVTEKFLVLGTDLGTLHVLDSDNGVEINRFEQHSERITSISIDIEGEFVASAADDGKVVIRNLYDDHQVSTFAFDRPVKSVAIDPEYKRHKKNVFVTGGLAGQLVYHEEKTLRLFGRSTTEKVLHMGEGPIRAIKWRSRFIAWSNDVGVKVYDTENNCRISYVDRPANSPRPDMYRCNLSFKDDYTLIIGWADYVTIGKIMPTNKPITAASVLPVAQRQPDKPAYYMQLLTRIQTDYWIAGVAPYGEDLILLAYLDKEEDVNGRTVVQGDEPEIRIMSVGAEEISDECLPMDGHEMYRSTDYWLEGIIEEQQYYIVSPKDIIVAKQRTWDDHIDWQIGLGNFDEAFRMAKEHARLLSRHSPSSVGLKHLLPYLFDTVKDYAKAASIAAELYGHDVKLWEDGIETFLRKQALSHLVFLIPTDAPRLSQTAYERTLAELLEQDPEAFCKILGTWDAALYDNKKMLQKLEAQCAIDQSSVPLAKALAAIYVTAKRFKDALTIYFRLRQKEAFDIINRFSLYTSVKGNLVALMEMDEKQTLELLIEHREEITLEAIVGELQQYPKLQLTFLERYMAVDKDAAGRFGKRYVELTAMHAPEKLMRVLQTSPGVPWKEATEICRQGQHWREYAVCLNKCGKSKDAIEVLVSQLGAIQDAIEMVVQDRDDSQWDLLIDLVLASKKPKLVKQLIDEAGAHIDPSRILTRTELRNMKIPDLKNSLVRILEAYNLQIELLRGCCDIFQTDCMNLLLKLNKLQKAAQIIRPEEMECSQCSKKVSAMAGRPDERVFIFNCQHVYCSPCLEQRMQDQNSRQSRSEASEDYQNYCPLCRRSQLETTKGRGRASRRR
ncbi:uncharacterized protein MONBRDRAFT_26746 [Monosiga brevicollis MX1]|uniref:RING-type domain-containing protein n=1 Tax=Monosiga brevicollis TaxID=81824 RepID=A9V391_MONBE|nr:uncharacterized protein MONBRDRAFT_26746 [Monosiga brevicollis MX1]EDQ88148.1 predicted protein [Monosiga brevicollis MX1]|eukprot:XP_001747224.1 hypothetical protein [Monosiga brevicollis MX1]